MPTFVYKAKDPQGALVEGTMDADGRNAVVSRLQQMQYFPVSIQVAGKKGAKSVSKPTPARSKTKAVRKLPAAKAKTSAPAQGLSFRKKVKVGDVANFNRQLADLIGAGIPLVKAMAILKKQTSNEQLQEVIRSILDDVQGGTTFAEALAKHPAVFSKLYVAMVRSGEAGGMLDEVLNRLADFSEQEELLRSRVKSALAYPVVMVLAGSGAVAVMFAYVIPKITGTYAQLGQSLPAITQILITMSNWFQHNWYIALGVLVAAAIGFERFTKTDEGKALWHRLQLKLPLIGQIVQKREVARFARTLGSLLRNGVSILSALEIVREVLDNSVFRGEVSRIIEEITQGSSVARPLTDNNVFPMVAVNMIAIGEETGRLPEVLLRISESYETQVDRAVKTITSLIEPLIIVAMGLVVGFIVIAMLLPIFSLDPTGGNL